nr:MAG: hypothetical protein DIU61_04715 [Bacteroidota bacterium]
MNESAAIDFAHTEHQVMIRQMIRDFAAREIRPYMMEWDETQTFPRDLFRKMGELGLMGMLVPQEYGGAGFGYLEYVTALEAISQVDGSIGLSMAAHNSLCTNHILTFGNEKQRQKYLPGLASGQLIGAWGLTEPNTGSDAANMNTVAVRDGDHYVLNGTKNFITHGITGDVAVATGRFCLF